MKLFNEVLKKNWKMMLFYIVIGIVVNFLDFFGVTYYQKILDNFQLKTLTITPLFTYALILIVYTILQYINNYPEQQVKNKLYLDFKLQALKKMKTINYLEYQKIGTGRLTQKVEDGAMSSRDVIVDFFLKTIRSLVPSAIFSVIFIFNVKKELVIFVILGYIIVVIISNILLKKLYSLKEKTLVNQELLSHHLIRGFMELVVFRTNKKYDSEIRITEKGIKNITDAKTRIKLVHEIFFSIFALIVNILKVMVLWYALFYSNLTVGAIVTVISLLSKAYEPIAIFNVEYVDYKLNKVSVKKYIEFLETKDDSNMINGKKITLLSGKISFKNVSFSYGTKEVIKNLNFEIPSKSRIAFVGQTGSGKSTIIKMIMGLLKYQKGKVYVDEFELKDLNLHSYYDCISYVSQEAPIFDGTLRENIVFDKKVSDEEIFRVLNLLNLNCFYSKLEKGLDSKLGEKGVKMSGGERQRVAIARIFFDNSSIVILDEATSAMDNLTEKIVMKNILSNLSKKTFVIIAHRLETIKDVDKIYVLKDGKIIESGNYTSLINKDSYFSKLYKVVNK